MNRMRAWIGAGTLAVALGCAGSGEFAKDAATSLGVGALEGFADYVEYGGADSWGDSWDTSGRGVSGVVPRSAVKPDCGMADDETQLYVGDLLASPGAFVSTLDGALDRSAYLPLTEAGFRLTGERAGGVIAILQTTAGHRARFVLRWDDQPMLHDLVVYDLATGEAVLRFDVPMPLAPHAMVNLDPDEAKGIDLLYGPAPSGRPTLAAASGAALSFPLESLCGD